MDLTELVARIVSGDRQAEALFVDKYMRGVRTITRCNTSDRSAAEDLSQESLRIALERIRAGAVKDPERLSGFVASVARNVAIEHGRRRMTRERVLTGGAHNLDRADAAASPLDQLLTDERAALARGVLAELPTPRDRELLFRFYVAEESKDDICTALGLTREHFTRVLFRARERYREEFRKRAPRSLRDESLPRRT